MEAFVVLGATIALVWGAVLAARGSLVAGCLAILLAVCCFGYEFVHFELGPLPMTVDRLLLGVLVAMLVVQRSLGRTDPKPMNAADWLFVTLIFYLAASMLACDWQDFRKGQVPPLWRWVGGYLTPLVIYWAAKQAPWNERTARWVQGALALFGLYLGFTAVCEITRQWAFVFPAYIADPKIGLHFGRARGPMVHGVSFGHYMGVCLLAAWLWTAGQSATGRAAKIALLPLYFAGVFFSYTRSVWMGTALGLCTVLVLTLRGRTRNAVLGGIAAAGLLVGVTQMDNLMGFQREQSAVDTRDSANLRVSFAYVSWQMFLDRPIFGFGFGRFPIDKLPYLADRSTDLNLEALRPYVHHNTYLSLLTDTGLVGLGLFLAAFGYGIRNAWLTYRAVHAPDWAKRQAILFLGALGIYACQLLFHELSYTPIDNSLVFFLAGAVSALRGSRVLEAGGKAAAIGDAAIAWSDAPARSEQRTAALAAVR